MIYPHGWKLNIQWEETINLKKSRPFYSLEIQVTKIIIWLSTLELISKKIVINLHRFILSFNLSSYFPGRGFNLKQIPKNLADQNN